MNVAILFFCVLAFLGALGLLLSRHPIRGAMGLLLTMASLAGIFAILEAHFIAAFQIIIYAGAIMVLIVYILMLLDVKTESYYKRFTNIRSLGLIVVGIVAYFSLITFGQIDQLGIPAVNEDFTSLKAISKELVTNYLLAFEVSSMVLLVGVIATIALVNRDVKEMKESQ